MKLEKINIIQDNISEIISIVEVCINSICYEPENNAPILYLYFLNPFKK